MKDTAAHVAAVAWLNTSVVAPDDAPPLGKKIREQIAGTTVDNVHAGLNATMLLSFPEGDRDSVLLRLQSSVAKVLQLTDSADPSRVVDWLGGSRIPLAGVLAHLTNELLLHGRDIARATVPPWHIPDSYAAQFFELLMIEIARNGFGRMLDDDRPVRPGRMAVEFRSAYTPGVTMSWTAAGAGLKSRAATMTFASSSSRPP